MSLEIPANAVTTLLGPNGAGKSSLVLAVGGVLRPTAGRVFARRPGAHPAAARGGSGRPVSRSSPRDGASCPELTVEDNLRVATYALGRSQAREGIDYALELFPQLERRWKASARTLSGGEQQMVVLAQALVSRPKFMLVDELSLGLAPLVVQRLVPTLAVGGGRAGSASS